MAHKARQEKEKEVAGENYHDEGLIFANALGKKIEPRRVYDIHCKAIKRANFMHIPFHYLRQKSRFIPNYP